MLSLRPKQASRKYVDLIHRAGTIWANWQPSVLIQAGDYGIIDEETGDFLKQGDIFHEPEIAEIASKYLPLTAGPPIDIHIIRTADAKKVNIAPDAHTSVPGVAEPTFSWQWQFGRTRGAIVVLHNLRITSLPPQLLTEIRKTAWGKTKQLVTQAYACSAYVLYLSDKKKETVSITLRGGSPAAPGVGAGAGIEAGWTADGVCGIFQQAYADNHDYVPLYQVKQVEKFGDNRNQFPEPPDDDKEDWLPIKVPWGILDDEGEELPDISEDDQDSDLE